MSASHRRLLIAVEPYLLATVLARLLGAAGKERFETVDVKGPRRGPAEDSYDVAIVTGGLPPGIRADVLIGLSEDGSQRAPVTSHDVTATVTIEGVETIVRLMDDQLLGVDEPGLSSSPPGQPAR